MSFINKQPLIAEAKAAKVYNKLNELLQTTDTLESSIKQSRQQNDQLLQQVFKGGVTKDLEAETIA